MPRRTPRLLLPREDTRHLKQQIEQLQAKLRASQDSQKGQTKGSAKGKAPSQPARTLRKSKSKKSKSAKAKAKKRCASAAIAPTLLAERETAQFTAPADQYPWRVVQALGKSTVSPKPTVPFHGSIAITAAQASTPVTDTAGEAAGAPDVAATHVPTSEAPPEKDLHTVLCERESARGGQSPSSPSSPGADE